MQVNAWGENECWGRELEVTRVEKDVGVIVEDTLKPSMQCAAAAAKANRILGQLSRAVQWRDKITSPSCTCHT